MSARYDTTGSGTAVSGRPARILQATGRVKVFGQTPALNGASVGVDRGEILAVKGPSGSGKSTMLLLLSGTRRGPATAEARKWFGTLGLDGLEGRRSGELAGHRVQRPDRVTHDARVAAYADREIVVSDGKVMGLTGAEG